MITKHHSRSGKLDKPESCHDQARASALNMMQAPPKAVVELIVTSASLLALFRVSAAPSGWLSHSVLIGARCGLVSRGDVMALVERGLCDERKKGIEITDAGNALVRALVAFAKEGGRES